MSLEISPRTAFHSLILGVVIGASVALGTLIVVSLVATRDGSAGLQDLGGLLLVVGYVMTLGGSIGGATAIGAFGAGWVAEQIGAHGRGVWTASFVAVFGIPVFLWFALGATLVDQPADWMAYLVAPWLLAGSLYLVLYRRIVA